MFLGGRREWIGEGEGECVGWENGWGGEMRGVGCASSREGGRRDK